MTQLTFNNSHSAAGELLLESLRNIPSKSSTEPPQTYLAGNLNPEETPRMAQFFQQFNQVIRGLTRAPMFTAITLLTLAVAIGANTVMFSVVNGILLKPLPYPDPEQLVGVWLKAPSINLPDITLGEFNYFIFREQNTVFTDIGAYHEDSVAVTGAGEPEHVEALDVTDGTLPLLSVKPALGRLFTRHDDSPGAPKTVILTYGYWQRRFGGSNSIVGRTLTADGESREIIGVLPKNFQFLDSPETSLFLPMQWDRNKVMLGNFNYQAIGRLKPGVTLAQASADIARMIPICIRSFPAPPGFSASLFEKAGIQPNLRPLRQDVTGDIGSVLWVLMGSIIVVLLVACANVANLLLVRVEGRRQELAIRAALGAGRARIASTMFLESLILGCTGSLIGLALAWAALRVLVAIAPTGLPRLHEIAIDLPVLLFTLGAALFVSLLIGLIPVAKYATHALGTELHGGGRALSQSRERHRARKTLVVVQVALALVLLICSGLMLRTFHALAQVSPGVENPKSLQAFSIDIPSTQVPDGQGERIVRMQQAMADGLVSIPGVKSVAISTAVPLTGEQNFNPVYSADRTYKEGELAPLRRFRFISPGFFSTIGSPLVAGRDFTWAEIYRRQPLAIISENFAREYWGIPANALGQRVRSGPNDDWRVIVGVAHDIYDDGVNKSAPSAIYLPLLQSNLYGNKEMARRGVSFILRTPRAGSSAFFKQVQQSVWAVDPDLPLANATTLAEIYTRSMARTSFTLVMLCVAGSMALLLGVVGIYGVISYAVSQRTREIGIRMALGAQRKQLVRMFVLQGFWLTSIGVVIGLGLAFGVMRLLSSLLFHVSPIDPGTYILASAVVIAVASFACFLPSQRAAVVDPMNALRAE